jgi:nitroreductase
MKKGNPYSQALDTAPLTIVIAVNTKTAVYSELLTLDAGIAVQSILVQVSKLGLASVPMSIAPQRNRVQGVSEALNIPSDVIPQMMICIGQPSVDTVSSASTNYYNENRVHYNEY